MRSINCQNIRSEIEAAGSADYLSQAALAHISGCAACETLSRQQSRLHSILSNLGTVEAPGDFDFKLRARLAGEKSAGGSLFSFLTFSFGARSAAVAMILLLVVAGVVYFKPKTPVNNLAQGNQPTAAPKDAAVAVAPDSPKPGVQQVTNNEQKPTELTAGGRNVKFVPTQPKNRQPSGSRDNANTMAKVHNLNDQDAFPINASRQPLKVSVADGRGGSRTISLPSVSFGSESGLSQNPTPLMASARGSW